MEITQTKSGDILLISLAGRLDASWSGAVQKEFDAAIRRGEHRIHLDLAKVDYISSAGLGALLTLYKSLHAINGHFGIAAASPFVQSALKMAGLGSLVATPQKTLEAREEKCRTETSPKATYDIFPIKGAGIRLATVGDSALLQHGMGGEQAEVRPFGETTVAIGIGALGSTPADCESRAGEFLAVSGVAAFQPADGPARPDFILSTENFVPEGQLLLGLLGEGDFPWLARFEAKEEFRIVGLTELAEAAFAFAQAPAIVMVGIAETSGLVGASLRQSPAPAATAGDRFVFPEIRDWLSFTSERAYRDSTSLIVGVVAGQDSPLAPLLRPLGADLLGHFHAASFPYRPLQKGRIDLKTSVAGLFESFNLQAVLHLLADPREFIGAGESEFLRGAVWIAPVLDSEIRNPHSAIA